VYFSSWQGEDLDSVAKALGKAKGFLRSSIGKKCRLRVTPALTFVHDDSAQKGAAIDALLAKALGKK
jgi:ribosome-binding factor A